MRPQTRRRTNESMLRLNRPLKLDLVPERWRIWVNNALDMTHAGTGGDSSQWGRRLWRIDCWWCCNNTGIRASKLQLHNCNHQRRWFARTKDTLADSSSSDTRSQCTSQHNTTRRHRSHSHSASLNASPAARRVTLSVRDHDHQE